MSISVRGAPDSGGSSDDGPLAGLGGTTGAGGATSFDGSVGRDGAVPDQGADRGPKPDASGDGRATDGGGNDAAADLRTGGDAAPDAPAPIDRPPAVCSMASSQRVTLTVINNYSNITVTPYWIDGNCQEQPYPQIGPGSSLAIGSFVSHPWRVRRTSDHALLIDVLPLTSNTTVTVP